MKRFLHLIRYIRLIKKNKLILEKSRINDNPNPKGIQYDWIYRLYTVLNLPFDDQENIKKYGIYYVDTLVQNHVVAINKFLFSIGILEYVTLDIDNIQQINEFNIRIVLKFKYLNLKFWARIVVFLSLALITAGIVSLIILL